MTIHRTIRPLITLVGTIALVSPFYLKLERLPTSPGRSETQELSPRRLNFAIDDSDPLVSAMLSVVSKEETAPISSADHERISRILTEAKELMGKAKGLLEEESEGASEIMDKATEKFKEAKEHIKRQRDLAEFEEEEESDTPNNLRAGDLVERKTGEEVSEEVDLELDLARNVYETVSECTFILCPRSHCTPLRED